MNKKVSFIRTIETEKEKEEIERKKESGRENKRKKEMGEWGVYIKLKLDSMSCGVLPSSS